MRRGAVGGLHSVLPAPLRFVERGVRAYEELLPRRAAGGRRDAEARGEVDGRSVQGEGRVVGEVLADTLGEVDAALGVGAREDEDELLAAPAAREVDVADRRAKDGAEVPEHANAREMPEP